MEPEFWHERWQNQQIGFHQQAGNAALRDAVKRLDPAPGPTVFVPLCGKSVDMAWLRARGHEVVGVELSANAIEAFFAEHGLRSTSRVVDGGLQRHEADGYTLYAGDFFALRREHLGPLAAVCDRAALVALPAPMRRRYAEHLLHLVADAPIALVTLDYAPDEMNGPPFPVVDEEVHSLFSGRRRIERLAAREVLGEESGLRKRGLSSLRETSWLLWPMA